MKKVFVDANVFLRFFTADVKGLHTQAVKLFRLAAEEKITLVCGPPVLFEIAWTLRSSYKQPRKVVNDVLSRILSFPGINIIDASVVEMAIQKSQDANVDFADSYITALCEWNSVDEIATFNNSDFKKLKATLYKWGT